MKYIRIIPAILLTVTLLASCSSSRSKLYNNNVYHWGYIDDNVTQYEIAVFEYLNTKTPKSLCDLITTYREIMEDCKDNERMIPPGICAEFGYLLLNPNTEAIFFEYATSEQKNFMKDKNFQDYGKQLIEKEKALYPESEVYLNRVVK